MRAGWALGRSSTDEALAGTRSCLGLALGGATLLATWVSLMVRGAHHAHGEAELETSVI
jgi:hypothetical protein